MVLDDNEITLRNLLVMLLKKLGASDDQVEPVSSVQKIDQTFLLDLKQMLDKLLSGRADASKLVAWRDGLPDDDIIRWIESLIEVSSKGSQTQAQ